MDQAESNMKLPVIKKATWVKEHYPDAEYIVVDRKYNTYYPCASLYEAICRWFRLLNN